MEVLSTIFEYYVEDGGDPLTVLWVSLTWSCVALSTRGIWSKIEITGRVVDKPAILTAALRRAGTVAPLDIVIEVDVSGEQSTKHRDIRLFEAVFLPLWGQGHRWRSLAFHSLPPGGQHTWMKKALETPLSNLKSFSLGRNVDWTVSRPLLASLAQTSLQLTHLTLLAPLFYTLAPFSELMKRFRSVEATDTSLSAGITARMANMCSNVEKVIIRASRAGHTLKRPFYMFPSTTHLECHDLYIPMQINDQSLSHITHLTLHACYRQHATVLKHRSRSRPQFPETDIFKYHLPSLISLSATGDQPEVLLYFALPKLEELELTASNLSVAEGDMWIAKIWGAEKKDRRTGGLMEFGRDLKALKLRVACSSTVLVEALAKMSKLEVLEVAQLSERLGFVARALDKGFFDSMGEVSESHDVQNCTDEMTSKVDKRVEFILCPGLRVLIVRTSKERYKYIAEHVAALGMIRQAAGRPLDVARCQAEHGE